MNSNEQGPFVQLGCGPFAIPGRWEDYDGSWNALLNHSPKFIRAALRGLYGISGRAAMVYPEHVRYLDLHKRFPFADNSVGCIYASHVWEHLYLEDAKRATAECFRVLRPGGRLRLVVPNLRLYCLEYVQSIGDSTAARRLQEKLLFRAFSREQSRLLRAYTALTDFHSHKFMHDEASLSALLIEAGFVEVEIKEYLVSGLPHLAEVESANRLLEGAGFAVEGLKR